MTTIADVFLKLASVLPGIANMIAQRQKVHQEQKDRLAVLLESIGFCLHDLCEEFTKAIEEGRPTDPFNISPRRWRYQGRCAELELYIANLREFLPKSIFAGPDAERLLELLLVTRVGPFSAIAVIEDNQGYLVFDISEADQEKALARYQNQMRTTGVHTFSESHRFLRPDVQARVIDELSKLASAAGKLRAAAALVRALP